MHYKGRELISRPTRASGRTLLFSAFAFYLVILNGGVGKKGIDVSSLTFSAETVKIGAIGLLIYLGFAHFVNFIGDVRSFARWNHPKPILGGIITIGQGAKLTTELDDAKTTLIDLIGKINKSSFKGLTDGESKALCEQIPTQLAELAEGHKSLSETARWVIFGWFAIIPLGAGAAALFLVCICL